MKITKKYVFLLFALLGVFAATVAGAVTLNESSKILTFSNADSGEFVARANDTTKDKLTSIETIAGLGDAQGLTKLDLSGCTALKSLGITNMKLTELNMTDCTSLTGLWGLGTDRTGEDEYDLPVELATVTMTGCGALTELGFTHTKLTTLDLSELDLSATELYMTGNSELTTLKLNSDTAKWPKELEVDYAAYKSVVPEGKRVILTKTKDGTFKADLSKVEGELDMSKIKGFSKYGLGSKNIEEIEESLIEKDDTSVTFKTTAAPVAIDYKAGSTIFEIADLADAWVEESEQKSEESEEKKSTDSDKAAADELIEDSGLSGLSDTAKTALEGAYKDNPTETKEIIETLGKSGLSATDIAELTGPELTAAVENKVEEKADAVTEKTKGVENTTKPAGTDLLADSSNASLKKANESLTVKPKVVTPVALAEALVEAVKEVLASLGTGDIADNVDATVVKAAVENLLTSADIEIDTASGSLEDQAKLLETIFDAVGEYLAEAQNVSGDKGVVIASVLPKMKPSKTGFFPMKVNLRNLTPGRRVKFWPSVEAFVAYVLKSSGKSMGLASEEGDSFFLDADNNPTAKVKGNAATDMTLVAYLEKDTEYDTAFITADASATDLTALAELEDEGGSTSGAHSGCELGLGALALASALPLLLRKGRK